MSMHTTECFILLLGANGRIQQAGGVGGQNLYQALRLAAMHVIYHPEQDWVKRVIIYSGSGARIYRRETLRRYLP
jgi:hypothetical protein